MKKILLLLLCLPFIGFGQDLDIITVQNQVRDINYGMDKHHQQFKKGVITSSAGALVTVVGTLVAAPVVIIVGGVTSMVGQIIMIDSHKWFKKEKFTSHRKIRKLSDRRNKLADLLQEAEISLEEYYMENEKIDEYIKELKK